MHRMKQVQKEKRNQGFSLLTVIVSVSFIGILGMLILYIALVNFNMKITGLKGKDSFYTAEQALEEIRTGLQEDVGEAMSVAYTEVLETYSAYSETAADATLDELRQSRFKELFIKELAKRLQKGTNTSQYSLAKLNGYLDMTDESNTAANNKISSEETMVVVNPDGKAPIMKKDVKNGILLKNLKAIYVDSAGRASIIETDIRLGIPKVQFPTPSTLPDLLHMSVIAGGGIVCEQGNAGDETVIQGKVYAGLLEDYKTKYPNAADGSDCVSVDIAGGANLSVESGDLFVCQGNINLGSNSKFTSANTVSVWAQGVNLTSSTIELLGKTYLADDLTVNTGSGSNVTLKGEYYGFGNASSANNSNNPNWITDTTKEPIYNEANRTASALSSAIVINGKNTTMDLSGLEKIMLAGKNYIASSRVTGSNANGTDVMTGESLTVKGTQLAYLVPAELLADGKYTNPMDYNTYLGLLGDNKNSVTINHTTKVTEWGNKTIDEIGVDSSNPVQEVFYNDNASGEGGYVYFYLNFTDTAKAAAFMQSYYSDLNVISETSGVKKTMKENVDHYLSFYFGDEAGITVGDPQSYLRYITNGNILTYSGNDKTGKLNSATDPNPSSTLTEEQTNYQRQWYSLNRRMLLNYELLNTNVTDSDGKFDHNETDCSRSVFDNMVNEAGLKAFVKKMAGQNKAPDNVYTFQSEAEDGGFSAILADNGENSDGSKGSELKIDTDKAQNLRLVVSTGDVRIKSGVTFYGIIMTKGKITLESGSSLVSSSLDAAKIFQAQSTTDEISPKSLFWDGDKYVLGNTTTTDDNTTTENKRNNTYDLAECVTYENWKKK